MNRKLLGEILKAKRNVSKSAFAKQTGLTRKQIDSIESGSSNYTVDSLLLYCNTANLKIMIIKI
jgi:transcriptional regulator with XRE-family HTH domain